MKTEELLPIGEGLKRNNWMQSRLLEQEEDINGKTWNLSKACS